TLAMTPVVEQASAGLETLTSPQRFADAALVRRWHELLAASTNLDKTFQSPAWFEHARANPGATPLDGAVIVRRARGAIDSIVPVVKDLDGLDFVVGSHTLRKIKLKSAMVLGSQLLAPEDERAYDELLSAIDRWAADCACITLPSVPDDSFLRRWTETSRAVRERFIVYAPFDPGTGKIFCTDFPATFDAYNAGLDKKRRDNFKRKVRVLDKQGKPGKLRRFDRAADVAEFLQLARAIAKKSWQSGIGVDPFPADVDWQRKLADQAERGLFRAYVLECGGEPAAFGVGAVAEGVFHYRATGFDQSLSALSPGTVLTYLMFSDLLGGPGPVQKMSFGFGDTPYKRLFCNRDFEASRVLLLRKTPANELVRLSHSTFRTLVARGKVALARGKELYARWRPPAPAAAAAAAAADGAKKPATHPSTEPSD
ncbi:MAG TPA: GNAT family N-acetyltransferase, partial [Polyangia bacterium]